MHRLRQANSCCFAQCKVTLAQLTMVMERLDTQTGTQPLQQESCPALPFCQQREALDMQKGVAPLSCIEDTGSPLGRHSMPGIKSRGGTCPLRREPILAQRFAAGLET